MKKAVFIDTNVFLLLYHFSKDDLETLEALHSYLSNKSIDLYLTKQIRDEFFRNRESTILSALNSFKDAKLNDKIPIIARNFEEDCKGLCKIKKDYENKHSILYNKIKESALNSQLWADKIMKSIFSIATIFDYDNDVYKKSLMRMRLGNPPGKKDDICDSINWELLLKNIGSNIDLIIISNDNDYSSKLDESKIHPFLLDEWSNQKNSSVELFKNLSEFFDKYIPELKLIDEEKEMVDATISSLEQSENFQTTHFIIAKLKKYEHILDTQQANRIINACLNNNQVNWIVCDSDIKPFIQSLKVKFSPFISQDILEKLQKCLDLD